jgi:hypothetical protein
VRTSADSATRRLAPGLYTRAQITCHRTLKVHNARRRRASPCRVHAATGTYTNTVASYRETATRSSSRGRARAPAHSREPSAGPSNGARPIPNDEEEEEEAAPEAPREPPVDEDNDDDLYAQPQARLARRLALDGVAELPANVRALLAQGLRSIYNDDDEYIELPEAMERAFRAAVGAKTVASDSEPKSYRCEAMRRPDSELWHQAMVREMEAHLENGTWGASQASALARGHWLQVGLQGQAQPRQHRQVLQGPPRRKGIWPAPRCQFQRNVRPLFAPILPLPPSRTSS